MIDFRKKNQIWDMKQKAYEINKSVFAIVEVVCPKSSNYRKGIKFNQNSDLWAIV
jgi:hypothetical protein